MWSYYGRKSKVIKYYPFPLYDTIIEPFAGTACYSLYKDNWKKKVILVDKSDVIINLWKYLQQAEESDILNLPDISNQQDISKLPLNKNEKALIYFCSNRGSAKIYKISGKWNRWNKNKVIIASNLHKIRHWNIIQGDYIDITNQTATWFIDPPYMFGGHRYKFSNKLINYNNLAEWCKTRSGQVIVCENSKANWLPFSFLKEMQGQKFKTNEMTWTKTS